VKKYRYSSILVVILFWSFFGLETRSEPLSTGDSIAILDFDQLTSYLHSIEAETVVVNFWATWCVPCVEEMPLFEKLNNDSDKTQLKVILVSLDFRNVLDKRLKPFLKEHNILSEVILLDDPKMNIWINKVSSDWSGAIPGTWIIGSGKSVFHEGKYEDYKHLLESINSINN
jgi:thiol-disulfide isomerase/thioredoxin